MTSAVGLLLAAGAGRRMGTPKALVHDPDGTSWLHRSLGALRAGGCTRLVVVLGAAHDRAQSLLDDDPSAGDVAVVVAADWEEGMGASLRAGLHHLGSHSFSAGGGPEIAVVSLVDLPDMGPDVVARLLDSVAPVGSTPVGSTPAGSAGAARATLARAAYAGVAGHPVILGADHWAPVAAGAEGDRGARDYLRQHPPRLVECGDLATGDDRDTPQVVPPRSKEISRG
ncbi:nucleotidyltransferase family protein [Dermatophilaceae bacterium Soc4.6]